ncbi:MAG: hydrogenase maturation protease [Candidatus Methanospirareceae archaeon]
MRVFVAGVGNKYMGDDGFGPRVVEELLSKELPPGVEARDVGLCGITLAPELADYDVVIFVDAVNMDSKPGTIYCKKIEREGELKENIISFLSIHETSLRELISFAAAIGTLPKEVFVIGCEVKEVLLREGLSEAVQSGVKEAVQLILGQLKRYCEW